LIHGGALYNSSGVTHIGFADVCDSLSAIEDVCFNEENTRMRMSLGELIAAVDADFEAHDALRAYVVNQAPKFGSRHPIAEKNAAKLIELEYELFNNAKNYRDGNYRVAYWTMTNHAGYGYVNGALPSGRKAKQPYSSGITPASQIDTDLTTALSAVARLDSEQIPGAYALNIKLSPMPVSAENAAKLGAVIEAYMREGGQQVQFNIHDYETLKAAKKAPDEHPHLVVRVSGYSAYFDALNSIMQDELIWRSQYNLQSHQLVKLEEGSKTS
jgi:formate C-acetyltransferase